MNLRAPIADPRVRVLMIEDDPEYQALVQRWLASDGETGFAISFAPRLDEAWHRIGSCDVFVLDLGLPDAAGMDTLVAARDLSGELPIVVLTGMDDGDLGRRALRAGADAFVPKRLAEADTRKLALRRALAAHGPTTPTTSQRVRPAGGGGLSGGGPVTRFQRALDDPLDEFWIDARFGSTALRPRQG
jgi:DNA-binding response OmpR family regulator